MFTECNNKKPSLSKANLCNCCTSLLSYSAVWQPKQGLEPPDVLNHCINGYHCRVIFLDIAVGRLIVLDISAGSVIVFDITLGRVVVW